MTWQRREPGPHFVSPDPSGLVRLLLDDRISKPCAWLRPCGRTHAGGTAITAQRTVTTERGVSCELSSPEVGISAAQCVGELISVTQPDADDSFGDWTSVSIVLHRRSRNAKRAADRAPRRQTGASD